MILHAGCVARDAGPDRTGKPSGVLLLGDSGAGKSDLLIRLLDRGFRLVADDQVEIDGGIASAPAALRGIVEVRGLGLLRLASVAAARLVLAVRLDHAGERVPLPERLPDLDLPLVRIDPQAASAALRVSLALDCALGDTAQVAGAFE